MLIVVLCYTWWFIVCKWYVSVSICPTIINRNPNNKSQQDDDGWMDGFHWAVCAAQRLDLSLLTWALGLWLPWQTCTALLCFYFVFIHFKAPKQSENGPRCTGFLYLVQAGKTGTVFVFQWSRIPFNFLWLPYHFIQNLLTPSSDEHNPRPLMAKPQCAEESVCWLLNAWTVKQHLSCVGLLPSSPFYDPPERIMTPDE